jgi:hypothetical protein
MQICADSVRNEPGGNAVRIFLNDEQLDVTLEQEKTLAEVFDSLSGWMNQGGLHPLSVTIDGDEREISERDTWGKTPIAEVGDFVLRVGSLNALRVTQLMTTIDYINLLIQIIDRSAGGEELGQSFASAIAEYPGVRQALPGLMSIARESFAEDFVELDRAATAVDPGSPENPGMPDAGKLNSFRSRIEQLRVLLLDRLREASEPLAELSSISASLTALLPELEEAGISLQTGRERDAYNLMFRLSEMTGKLIRVLDNVSMEIPGTVDDDLRSRVNSLGSVVSEMNKTMADQDQVLLADLLEYDLRESLEHLIEGIGSIKLEAP